MSTTEVDHLDDNDDYPAQPRHSINSSDDHISPVILDDETPEEIKLPPKPRQQKSQISKFKNSKKLSTSMIIIDSKSPSLKTR